MRGSGTEQHSAAVRYPRRNVLAVGLLVIFTILALWALVNLVMLAPTDSQTSSFVTITGTPTCLPHKDTTKPVTLECVLGLKGDDGRYYELSNAPINTLQGNMDSRVKVRGILAEPDSSSQYDTSGSIAVSSLTTQ